MKWLGMNQCRKWPSSDTIRSRRWGHYQNPKGGSELCGWAWRPQGQKRGEQFYRHQRFFHSFRWVWQESQKKIWQSVGESGPRSAIREKSRIYVAIRLLSWGNQASPQDKWRHASIHQLKNKEKNKLYPQGRERCSYWTQLFQFPACFFSVIQIAMYVAARF